MGFIASMWQTPLDVWMRGTGKALHATKTLSVQVINATQ
jgi:hypothetical protein